MGDKNQKSKDRTKKQGDDKKVRDKAAADAKQTRPASTPRGK